MANAWGVSWGSRWGVSWGSTPVVTTPAPNPGGAGSAFRGGGRRRAEYVDRFRQIAKQRKRTEELERLDALEREALANADSAAQELENAKATDRANAQYEQSITRLAQLSDKAERALEAATKLRQQAEQDAEDEEDAIAMLLLN